MLLLLLPLCNLQPAHDAERVRAEAHGKVDELYTAAKAEL